MLLDCRNREVRVYPDRLAEPLVFVLAVSINKGAGQIANPDLGAPRI